MTATSCSRTCRARWCAHPQSNTSSLDFSNPKYGHAYFVDATPGTGDVFYTGTWHTWLVGGLGGSRGDVCPGCNRSDQFSESSPTSTVIAEWTPSGIPGGCAGASSCGDSMGNISGIPQIRRFHNGKWGAVFGNGTGSAAGDAGIFIMLIDSGGKPSLRYLSATKRRPRHPETTGSSTSRPPTSMATTSPTTFTPVISKAICGAST